MNIQIVICGTSGVMPLTPTFIKIGHILWKTHPTCFVQWIHHLHGHYQAAMLECYWSPDFPTAPMSLICHGTLSHLHHIIAEMSHCSCVRKCPMPEVSIAYTHELVQLSPSREMLLLLEKRSVYICYFLDWQQV